MSVLETNLPLIRHIEHPTGIEHQLTGRHWWKSTFEFKASKSLNLPKKLPRRTNKLVVRNLARGVDDFAHRLSFRFSVLWMAIKSLIKSRFGSLNVQDIWLTDHLPLP